MTVSSLLRELGWKSLWDGWKDRPITGAYTSDLLSDVMANADESQILLTIQAHKNSIAVAVLKDLSALVVCSNRPVPKDMVEAAKEENLPLLITDDNQYAASWRFHDYCCR